MSGILVEEVSPRRVTEIAAIAGTAVVASTALASTASAVVSQGGITMSIGQAIASSSGLKFATGGLAAALALGGGAMATDNLVCEIAPAAEVRGNLVVETGLDGSADAQVEQRVIEVEGLGLVDVAHSDVDVEVLGIQLTDDDATAEVRSESRGGAEIAFTLDGVTRTLLVSVVDGELFASLAHSVSADGAAVDADANANANANGALGIDLDADAGSEGAVDANSEIDNSSDLDVDGEVGILGGLGVGGDGGILGSLGIDAEIDN